MNAAQQQLAQAVEVRAPWAGVQTLVHLDRPRVFDTGMGRPPIEESDVHSILGQACSEIRQVLGNGFTMSLYRDGVARMGELASVLASPPKKGDDLAGWWRFAAGPGQKNLSLRSVERFLDHWQLMRLRLLVADLCEDSSACIEIGLSLYDQQCSFEIGASTRGALHIPLWGGRRTLRLEDDSDRGARVELVLGEGDMCFVPGGWRSTETCSGFGASLWIRWSTEPAAVYLRNAIVNECARRMDHPMNGVGFDVMTGDRMPLSRHLMDGDTLLRQLAGMSRRDWLALCLKAHRLDRLSRGGFDRPPLLRKGEPDSMKGATVCRSGWFSIGWQRLETGRIRIFVRGRSFACKSNPALFALLGRINHGHPVAVQALVDEAKGQLRERTVLALLRALWLHRGIELCRDEAQGQGD